MYKARKNLGIYFELRQLINYIAEVDENLLDELIVKFRGPGLSLQELRQASSLIEEYLPAHIECDISGCYFVSVLDNGEEVHTPFPEESIDTVPVIDLVTERELIGV